MHVLPNQLSECLTACVTFRPSKTGCRFSYLVLSVSYFLDYIWPPAWRSGWNWTINIWEQGWEESGNFLYSKVQASR